MIVPYSKPTKGVPMKMKPVLNNKLLPEKSLEKIVTGINATPEQNPINNESFT